MACVILMVSVPPIHHDMFTKKLNVSLSPTHQPCSEWISGLRHRMNCIGRHFPPLRAASSPEGCRDTGTVRPMGWIKTPEQSGDCLPSGDWTLKHGSISSRLTCSKFQPSKYLDNYNTDTVSLALAPNCPTFFLWSFAIFRRIPKCMMCVCVWRCL